MSAPVRHTVDTPHRVAAITLTSVTSTGTTGVTHLGYKLVGRDSSGNHTAASAEVVATDGNATQSGVNYEVLAWTDPVGVATIDVYRTTGGATQGKIGSVAAGVGAFNDTGLVADGSTAPVADNTGTGVQSNVPANVGASVFVSGTFVGTLQVKVSVDGTNFVNAGAAFTAPGYIALPVCVAVMVSMTAYTSGAPVATLLYVRQ